jgi:hypothetical protein
MKLKPGVNAEGVQPPTWYMLGVAEMVYSEFNEEMVVTSLTDGIHPDVKNIHGRGYAADLRIAGLAPDRPKDIRDELQRRLFPLGYDIVLEADHIHAEWDPKPTREQWMIQV